VTSDELRIFGPSCHSSLFTSEACARRGSNPQPLAPEADVVLVGMYSVAVLLPIALQKAFVEYAFGKVPDKLETTGLENKPVLILHYAHERPQRDQHQRFSSGLS